MTTNYYFDPEHNPPPYVRSCPANAGTVQPVDAIRVAPPVDFDDGFWPAVNPERDGWMLVPDFRGREGFVDGVPVTITELGSLPQGWSDAASPMAAAGPAAARMLFSAPAAASAPEDGGDDLLREAYRYSGEAEGLRLLEALHEAAEAEEKAREYFRAYAEKKRELRAALA